MDFKQKRELMLLEKQIEKGRTNLLSRIQHEEAKLETRLMNLKLHHAVSKVLVDDALNPITLDIPSEHLPSIGNTEERKPAISDKLRKLHLGVSSSLPDLRADGNLSEDEANLQATPAKKKNSTESESGFIKTCLSLEKIPANKETKQKSMLERETEKLLGSSSSVKSSDQSDFNEFDSRGDILKRNSMSLGQLNVKECWLGDPDAIGSVRRGRRTEDERHLRRLIVRSLDDVSRKKIVGRRLYKKAEEDAERERRIQSAAAKEAKLREKQRNSFVPPYPVYFADAGLKYKDTSTTLQKTSPESVSEDSVLPSRRHSSKGHRMRKNVDVPEKAASFENLPIKFEVKTEIKRALQLEQAKRANMRPCSSPVFKSSHANHPEFIRDDISDGQNDGNQTTSTTSGAPFVHSKPPTGRSHMATKPARVRSSPLPKLLTRNHSFHL
ncbi:uncharacterized protein LOC106171774 [Lingula anatina]|uniref:Uncharacterized protein LOC106171774 n=1 Tax=Lingula anatina TaxID=7574 RepID=A0A1S3JBY4_LINAN|nr:uncharacterized protein LOC106171774 [Lingula anatina]|eukprot:XP_013407696.1 uncharacterized protein LOC106171774 [Lingula anatina]